MEQYLPDTWKAKWLKNSFVKKSFVNVNALDDIIKRVIKNWNVNILCDDTALLYMVLYIYIYLGFTKWIVIAISV